LPHLLENIYFKLDLARWMEGSGAAKKEGAERWWKLEV
jgi:hypothetical protein